jgi:hypothetical protein
VRPETVNSEQLTGLLPGVGVERPGQQISPLRFASVERTNLWWKGRDSRSPAGMTTRRATATAIARATATATATAKTVPGFEPLL